MARRPSRGVGIRRKKGDSDALIARVAARIGGRVQPIAVVDRSTHALTIEDVEEYIRDAQAMLDLNRRRIAVGRAKLAELRGENSAAVN